MGKIFIKTRRPTVDEIAAMVGLTPKERANVKRVAREVLEKEARRTAARRNGKRSKRPNGSQ